MAEIWKREKKPENIFSGLLVPTDYANYHTYKILTVLTNRIKIYGEVNTNMDLDTTQKYNINVNLLEWKS